MSPQPKVSFWTVVVLLLWTAVLGWIYGETERARVDCVQRGGHYIPRAAICVERGSVLEEY